jgi:hypothetical protein
VAHLWVRDVSEKWAVAPLDGEAFTLTANPLQPVRVRRNKDESDSPTIILRRQGPDGETWVLMTAIKTGVRVNGTSLLTGIYVLRDRDELRVDGMGPAFFSTERLACVEPFPGAGQPMFCPRCKQEMSKQYPAVKCPQCGVWLHQSEDLPCWVYSERCALCDQATELDAGYRWTPADL